MADESTIWSDPAFYIACLALFVSALQTGINYFHNKSSDKRTKFIENINVEFTKIELALDELEDVLVSAQSNKEIKSPAILSKAVPAMRQTRRSINKVAAMKTVEKHLIDTKKLDEIDEILTFATGEVFEGPNRDLHIATCLKITSRVARYCSQYHLEIQAAHL